MGLAGIGAQRAGGSVVGGAAVAVVVARGGAGFTPVLRMRPSRALFARILSVGLVACALASVANLTTIRSPPSCATTAPPRWRPTASRRALEFLMIPLAFGVGSALTALVGRAVGAGDEPARRTA